jgi:hypothetical protein
LGRSLSAEQRDDYPVWVENDRRARELFARIDVRGVGVLEADPRSAGSADPAEPVDKARLDGRDGVTRIPKAVGCTADTFSEDPTGWLYQPATVSAFSAEAETWKSASPL